jgi:hypothetical protein
MEAGGLQRYETDGIQRYETDGSQRYETDGMQRLETDGNARYEMGYGGEHSSGVYGGVRRRNRSHSREIDTSKKRKGMLDIGEDEVYGRRH